MNCIGLSSCISDLAILVLGGFGELSAGFGESGVLGGQGILHLPTNLEYVFSVATLDRPAANLFETAATSMRAAKTHRCP